MGDRVKIDTGGVGQVALDIGRVNKKMQDEFQEVDNAFGQLLNSWHSDAAGRTNESYNWMKNTFVQPRFQIIDLQKTLLEQRIAPGYESVETQNVLQGQSMQSF